MDRKRSLRLAVVIVNSGLRWIARQWKAEDRTNTSEMLIDASTRFVLPFPTRALFGYGRLLGSFCLITKISPLLCGKVD
jgi:hypothetical protein